MMSKKIEQERLEQLERCIPDIWDYKTYLYVGANEQRWHFAGKLADIVFNKMAILDVVEVNEAHIPYLINQTIIRKVYHDDIRNFRPWLDPYAVIIWSHGPTCLDSKDEATQAINYLKQTGDLLVLMCPWGKYENAPETPEYEINHLALYPPFFENLGFKVDAIGEPNTNGSNLLAWWRK